MKKPEPYFLSGFFFGVMVEYVFIKEINLHGTVKPFRYLKAGLGKKKKLKKNILLIF